MIRKTFTALGAVLAIALAGSCHNDSNTVTGPNPMNPTPRSGTPVPTSGPATPIPTSPPSATPTPASSQTATVNVGQGGGNAFMDQASGTTTTTIRAGGTVNWVWVSGFHSTTSGSCPGACNPDGQWDSGTRSSGSFSHTFSQAGSFPYHCSVHGAMMRGIVVVQ
jgi:plastocyanin